jgi:hypothetical protein
MRNRLVLSLLPVILNAIAGQGFPEVKARKPDLEAIESAERKRKRKRDKRLRQGRP